MNSFFLLEIAAAAAFGLRHGEIVTDRVQMGMDFQRAAKALHARQKTSVFSAMQEASFSNLIEAGGET